SIQLRCGENKRLLPTRSTLFSSSTGQTPTAERQNSNQPSSPFLSAGLYFSLKRLCWRRSFQRGRESLPRHQRVPDCQPCETPSGCAPVAATPARSRSKAGNKIPHLRELCGIELHKISASC